MKEPRLPLSDRGLCDFCRLSSDFGLCSAATACDEASETEERD